MYSMQKSCQWDPMQKAYQGIFYVKRCEEMLKEVMACKFFVMA
jgi:hypothetical protein